MLARTVVVYVDAHLLDLIGRPIRHRHGIAIEGEHMSWIVTGDNASVTAVGKGADGGCLHFLFADSSRANRLGLLAKLANLICIRRIELLCDA